MRRRTIRFAEPDAHSSHPYPESPVSVGAKRRQRAETIVPSNTSILSDELSETGDNEFYDESTNSEPQSNEASPHGSSRTQHSDNSLVRPYPDEYLEGPSEEFPPYDMGYGTEPEASNPESIVRRYSTQTQSEEKFWHHKHEPHAERFRKQGTDDQALELKTEIRLIRAKAAWLRQDWAAMVQHSVKAEQAAGRVPFPPLVARVHFYLGIARFNQGDFNTAWQAFDIAEHARGVYEEAEYLEDWKEKCKKALNGQPDDSEERDEEEEKLFRMLQSRTGKD